MGDKKQKKPASESGGIGSNEARIVEMIRTTEDAAKLRQIGRNARRLGYRAVEDAALRRLVSILSEDAPGTVEHDFWSSIHAFEEILSQESGKTTRLSRTRQKVTKVGIRKVLEDFATSGKPADGFQMLIDRGMPGLTGEAVILRHAADFDETVRKAASARLEGAGVDLQTLPHP